MEMGKVSKDPTKPNANDTNSSKGKTTKKKPVKESKQLSSCDEESLQCELDKIKSESLSHDLLMYFCVT